MFERLYSKLKELPVSDIAQDVAKTVLEDSIGLLSSSTGSGKSLLASTYLAENSRIIGKQVLVLVPRRFLAINAAETICDLAGLRLGREVGYVIGQQQGEESRFSDDTALLISTYGYALSSGLIESVPVVVLDEVHEQSIDIAVARAVLHNRRMWKNDVNILEMSATINAENQVQYWQDIASTKLFHAEGKSNPCEIRERAYQSLAEPVNELLDEGHRGILVFRPGIAEIKKTERDIRQLLIKRKINNVEIATIHGDMNGAMRKEAMSAPSLSKRKILIGTNVIESGLNIPWVSAGVSCGTGKEVNINSSGISSLDLILLPQWRLQQQAGRVNRFGVGTFVLASDKKWKDRPVETTPELLRLPLTEVLMHCMRYRLNPEEDPFQPVLNAEKVRAAKEELSLLGLMKERFLPTEAGNFALSYTNSAQTGSMLWQAKQIGILEPMLPYAAVMLAGGIRKDLDYGHRLDDRSDIADGVKAFSRVLTSPAIADVLNVDIATFRAANGLLEGMRRTLEKNPQPNQRLTATDAEIRECLLAGGLHKLYRLKNHILTSSDGLSFNISAGSIAQNTTGYDFALADPFAIRGNLTIGNNVTLLRMADLANLAKTRPGLFTASKAVSDNGSEKIMLYLQNEAVPIYVKNLKVIESSAERVFIPPIKENIRTLWDVDARKSLLRAATSASISSETVFQVTNAFALIVKVGESCFIGFQEEAIANSIMGNLKQHHPDYLQYGSNTQIQFKERDKLYYFYITPQFAGLLEERLDSDPRRILMIESSAKSPEISKVIQDCLSRFRARDRGVETLNNRQDLLNLMLRESVMAVIQNGQENRTSLLVREDRISRQIYMNTWLFAPDLAHGINYGEDSIRRLHTPQLFEVILASESTLAILAEPARQLGRFINDGKPIVDDSNLANIAIRQFASAIKPGTIHFSDANNGTIRTTRKFPATEKYTETKIPFNEAYELLTTKSELGSKRSDATARISRRKT